MRERGGATLVFVLAQASDWSVIVKTGTMVPNAVGRVHEGRDNIFPDLDYRIYLR